MKLSVIIPTLDGHVPQSLRDRIAGCDDIELVTVTGVSPVGKARNEGLRLATGEWIAWVDADDEVAEDWLSEILAALADKPDIVTMDAELVGWENRTACVWGVPPAEATAARLLEDVYRDVCRPSWLPIYVTRRSLWANLLFDETVRVAEDYLILPKVLAGARSCRYVPKKLYRYVRAETSLSSTQSATQTAEQIDLWERRLAECSVEHRGACRWGLAVSAYWVCRLAAFATRPVDPQARANAARCRKIVSRSLPALVRESLVSRTLPLGDRVSWMVRFASAALNVWTLQRLRHRRRCA